MMEKRPNIIIFNPGRVYRDALHHLGDPTAITPFLGSLAQTEAVSFRSVFYQNSVCMFSRCSFMSGLYPRMEGHRTMGHLLHIWETSLLRELKEDSCYMWSNARDDLVAGQIPEQIASHVTELYYGGNAESAPGPVHEYTRGKRGDKNFYLFCTGELELDEHGRNYNDDDEDLNAAIECILHPANERPLYLFLGAMYPHPPYRIEEPYFSAIDRTLPPDRIRAEDIRGKTLILELIQTCRNIQTYTEDNWKELRAVYLGMCIKIGSQFRRLYEALKLVGICGNSAIFFFSDHGDYTGDCDLTEKTQSTFEDCLANVPFLVKPPEGYELGYSVADSLIELVDFYATALDFAEISPARDHFGKSLAPVIADRQKQIRSFVCYEEGRRAGEIQCRGGANPDDEGRSRDIIYWSRYTAQWNDDAHTKDTMTRNDEYKYVYCSNGASEFHDLELDLGGTVDLVDEPEYQTVIRQITASLLSWYQDTCSIVPRTTSKRFSRQVVWEEVERLCPTGHKEEVRSRIEHDVGLFPTQKCCRQLRKQQETNSAKNK